MAIDTKLIKIISLKLAIDMFLYFKYNVHYILFNLKTNVSFVKDMRNQRCHIFYHHLIVTIYVIL